MLRRVTEPDDDTPLSRTAASARIVHDDQGAYFEIKLA